MSLVSRASTLKLQEERRLKFTDPELFETPFVFMNGHNSFVLTEAEVANLRKYLSHGGLIFASRSCPHPNFPETCRIDFATFFSTVQPTTIIFPNHFFQGFLKIDPNHFIA